MQKPIIPEDTRYVPLTQQAYLCVPTCIQMVMARHHIPLQSAELIGFHLNLIVPEAEKYLFWNIPSQAQTPPAGWGTKINEGVDVDAVFASLNIPLQMKFDFIDKFQSVHSMRQYLQKAEEEDRDILMCFNVAAIKGTDEHQGHVCVFDRIYGDRIRYIDPSGRAAKWRIITVDKMYAAMTSHGSGNMGGCWQLNRI